VKSEGLDLTDVAEMDISPSEQKVYSLKKGDVLIVEGVREPHAGWESGHLGK